MFSFQDLLCFNNLIEDRAAARPLSLVVCVLALRGFKLINTFRNAFFYAYWYQRLWIWLVITVK